MSDILHEYLVFTFSSTYHALKAERVLKNLGYDLKLAPIPRQLSANCGEVIKVEPNKEQEIKEHLQRADVKIDEIHLVQERKKTSLMDKFFGY